MSNLPTDNVEEALPSPSTEKPLSAGNVLTHPESVLVVEDNLPVMTVLNKTIEKHLANEFKQAPKVVGTDSADHAYLLYLVALRAGKPFGVLVTDNDLTQCPEKGQGIDAKANNGVALIQKIREFEKNSGIAKIGIVLESDGNAAARAEVEGELPGTVREKAKAAGMDHFLGKMGPGVGPTHVLKSLKAGWEVTKASREKANSELSPQMIKRLDAEIKVTKKTVHADLSIVDSDWIASTKFKSIKDVRAEITKAKGIIKKAAEEAAEKATLLEAARSRESSQPPSLSTSASSSAASSPLSTPDLSTANSADPFIEGLIKLMPEMSQELVQKILQSTPIPTLKRTATDTSLDRHDEKRVENGNQKPVSKPTTRGGR
ncbi:MAG: hypothetical protein V4568_19015 [Pseudomonadota bacterium]